MIPNLVYADGTTANMNNGVLLHHFVLFNPTQQGVGCPIKRAVLRRRQRAHASRPADAVRLQEHVPELVDDHAHRQSQATAQTRQHQIIFRYRPLSETQPTRPAVARHRRSATAATRSTRSRPATPTRHVDWTSPVDARMIDMSGICTTSTSSTRIRADPLSRAGRRDRAVGRARGRPVEHLLRTDPAEQPAAGATSPERPCAAPRATTELPTDRARIQRPSRHDESLRDLLGPPGDPAARGVPVRRRISFDGLPDHAGQVIRLHSEYQNGIRRPEDRRDGDHDGLVAFPDPGYPRPKGATPMRASLVPAYNQCTSPNRGHGAPSARGRSCNPPGQASGFLTVGHPGRQRRTPQLRRLGADGRAARQRRRPPPTRPT